jgi:CubicO group peptidase (beta-lactamase class C family)
LQRISQVLRAIDHFEITSVDDSPTGKLDYAKAFGRLSVDKDAEPLKLNSVLFLASMTKLLTSIAAMQIVEKGLISLETDVTLLIPDLAKQPILRGFEKDSGKPITSPRKNPIKFVHLLTHSAGTSYDTMQPELKRYRDYTGHPPNRATMENKCAYPLLFEPGTYWCYGTGLDWAGRVIEVVTGESLQDYMQKNMFDPLGIKHIKFTPNVTAEMKQAAATLSSRNPETDRVVNLKPGANFDEGDIECFGGHGGYADLTDYLKVLESILKDDQVLLKKQTTQHMFRPHLTPAAKKGMAEVFAIPTILSLFIGDFPNTVTYDWGIGGLLVNGNDTSTQRKKDTMIWSGAPNLFWVSLVNANSYTHDELLIKKYSLSTVKLDCVGCLARRYIRQAM